MNNILSIFEKTTRQQSDLLFRSFCHLCENAESEELQENYLTLDQFYNEQIRALISGYIYLISYYNINTKTTEQLALNSGHAKRLLKDILEHHQHEYLNVSLQVYEIATDKPTTSRNNYKSRYKWVKYNNDYYLYNNNYNTLFKLVYDQKNNYYNLINIKANKSYYCIENTTINEVLKETNSFLNIEK